MSEQQDGWWSDVKKRFSRKDKKAAPDQAKPSEEESKDKTKPLMDQFEGLAGILPSGIKDNEQIVSELLGKLQEYRTYFLLLGRWHGVLGIESDAEATSLSKAHSEHIQIELETTVDGVKNALERDKNYKKDERDRIQKEYDDEHEYLKYLEVQRRYSSNAFSWPLAILYLVIGVALFISDIPLALNLISSGFRMLVSQNEAYSLDNLFLNPWEVFISNWEAFFTAFGIAFVTIYIKMFYDDYVGFAEGANSIRMSKMKNMGGDYELTLAENKRKYYIRLIILAMVITMLGILAIFRSESVHLIDPKFQDTWLSRTVFFFITLMLPIISGICFSVSLKTFQNVWRRIKAISDVKKMRKKLENAIRILDEADRKFEVVAALMSKWVKGDRFYNFMIELLRSYYQLGYEQGLREPETYDGETDYMRRVEIMRNKVLARNTFKRIKEQSI